MGQKLNWLGRLKRLNRPPGRSRSRRLVLALASLAAVAVAVALVVAWVAGQVQARQDAAAALERGRQHFEGATGLVGRMAGHDLSLPALATRCANCHALGEAGNTGNVDAAGNAGDAARRSPAGASASTALGSAAPILGNQGLSTLRQRRGGPASSYDSNSLCRLLALGQDPVHVVISTAMPRYEVSPEQCQELWTYLTAR